MSAVGTHTGDPAYFRRVAALLAPVADALHKAHESGIVHRDVKPSNLLLESDGRLRLVDFGLAQSGTERDGLTRTGAVMGTPEYMSPEQATGESVDARTDTWSLGAVLFEMLTLQSPVLARGSAAACDATTWNTQVPRALAAIAQRAMGPREGRYETTGAMAQALHALAQGWTEVDPSSPVRRTRRVVLGAAAVLVAASAVTAYALRGKGSTVEDDASPAVGEERTRPEGAKRIPLAAYRTAPDAQAKLQITRPLIRAAQWEEALPKLRQFCKDLPDDWALRHQLLICLWGLGRKDDCRREAEAVLAKWVFVPSHEYAHVLFYAGRRDEATRVLDAMRKFERPRYVQAALVAARLDDYDRVLEWLRRAKADGRRKTGLAPREGDLLRYLGRPAFDALIDELFLLRDTRAERGTSFRAIRKMHRNGEYEKVLERVETTLREDPGEWAAQFWKLATLWTMGERHAASGYAHELIAAGHLRGLSAVNQAAVLSFAGERARTQEMLDRTKPAHKGQYTYAAGIAARIGDRERCVAWMRRAVEAGVSGLTWAHIVGPLQSMSGDETFDALAAQIYKDYPERESEEDGR